ncbi:MAG: hypothetical protein JSW54_10390 [Fidelibacterota bacterium]|nr:MAG: hypothetical protein JSW54_10390 [Candidatus Neomarinimicrobiota bacterium]
MKKYHVLGYPTVAFLRADGSEVDRILGYAPPDEFLSEMERISAGDSTFESWRQRVADSPADLKAQLALAAAYKFRNMYTETVATGRTITGLAQPGSPEAARGRFLTAWGQAGKDTVPEPLLEVIREDPDSPFYHDIFDNLITIYRANKDTLNEVWAFRELIGRAIAADRITYSMLNAYAWRMTRLDTNLEDALEKAVLAVDLAKEKDADVRTNIMDTHAEVLWMLGRTAEAIQVMDKCIELDPESDYFKEQKAKFEETLAGG